jgi:hypothetical protein
MIHGRSAMLLWVLLSSHVTCPWTCHMSHVTCHMSHVTCHMSHVTPPPPTHPPQQHTTPGQWAAGHLSSRMEAGLHAQCISRYDT